jgi:hypothetical protein
MWHEKTFGGWWKSKMGDDQMLRNDKGPIKKS